MRIGIVGAGFIGRALAGHAMSHGHDVMMCNSRGPVTLASTVAAIGCKAGTYQDVAKFGDLIFLAIPFGSLHSIDPSPLGHKIVVDANNYYPHRDGRIAALDNRETTTSELVAAHLKNARVVKAFNAILQRDLLTGGQLDADRRRAIPVASDDHAAKTIVSKIIEEFGFEAVDAGALANSWRFERAKPAYCIPLDATELRAALTAATRDGDLPDGSWRR